MMNMQRELIVRRDGMVIDLGLRKDGQAVAATFGEGAIGVDDQQIERGRTLERTNQQAVRSM
jgi:hypothetical protein